MVAINEKTILALSPQATFQSLGESAVILMIDSGQLYSCNETTEAFLKVVNGSRSLSEIIDTLVSEFEVDHETLRKDLLALAADLSSEGIITVS